MARVLAWLAWWLLLFWLWLALAGEWNATEWVAGAGAAALAATLGELARARVRLEPRLPARALADVPQALLQVVVDFGLLVWALAASVARREVVRGAFRTHALEPGGDDAAGAGLRAWLEIAATYSPNAYVVDIDARRRLVLLHDLVPSRASERPA
ncbi:MAG TPA: hypothetical protein VE995_03925 [Gaiellaceae bacterium]|nr:hypothetical protein [Gaiellaceae bacterium]